MSLKKIFCWIKKFSLKIKFVRKKIFVEKKFSLIKFCQKKISLKTIMSEKSPRQSPRQGPKPSPRQCPRQSPRQHQRQKIIFQRKFFQ